MTAELTKAAPELDTPTLRELVIRLALEIDPEAKLEAFPEALAFQIDMARAILAQRPAAQTERELFEVWWESDGPNTSSPYDAAMSGWLAGRASQQATPKPVVPEMSSIAIRKLGGLQDRGWQINGYAIRRGNERGLIDSSGFVGWWRSEIATVVPDDVARDAGWFRLIRDGSGWPAVFASHDAPEPLRGDDLDAAMIAASQQKGGSAG